MSCPPRIQGFLSGARFSCLTFLLWKVLSNYHQVLLPQCLVVLLLSAQRGRNLWDLFLPEASVCLGLQPMTICCNLICSHGHCQDVPL